MKYNAFTVCIEWIKETLLCDIFTKLSQGTPCAKLSATSVIIWCLICPSLREYKCTGIFTRVFRSGIRLHVSLSHFHCTEDDSQPDCSCLLWQCCICHGELLLPDSLNTHTHTHTHTHSSFVGGLWRCFPVLFFLPHPGWVTSRGIALQLSGLVANVLW